MLILPRSKLKPYLQDTCDYSVIDIVDMDWLISQPRNTLYKLAKNWYRPEFSPNQRIVFFGNCPSRELLEHIQVCLSKVDISNFFVLVCSPLMDQNLLEELRKNFSTDDLPISHLAIDFEDSVTKEPNNFVNLPESWCFVPWAHLEISPSGEFRPCCVYSEFVKRDDGTNYNIFTDDIETVYNSRYLRDLRQQFRDGKKPKGCSKCWQVEASGGSANRHWMRDFLGVNADLLEIEKDTVDNLISFDIKLGNICNFKCRICNESSSSMIAAEKLKFFSIDKMKIKKINSQGRWSKDSEIWKSLSRFQDQLINVDFYGGEPFLIREHKIFLERLVESNNAKNVRLHYNSNGSIYPDDLLDLWQHFREINISFSIDNIGNRFEVERTNGIWGETESNLERFLSTRKPNMLFGIFATVNIQNVFYIPELINWYETKQFDSLLFNILTNPKYLSITSMSDALAKLVLNKLYALSPDQLKKYKIDSIINLIKESDTGNNSVQSFIKFMLELDYIRNQKFEVSHPEVADAINYSHYRKNHGQTF
jgi:MoaA/NifB/PqqE/SkfB family radical SAM enzyme